MEGTVEDLWRQFQAALNNYNATTEERKKQFEELKQKDQKNAKEIEHQMKKLVKLQVTIMMGGDLTIVVGKHCPFKN